MNAIPTFEEHQQMNRYSVRHNSTELSYKEEEEESPRKTIQFLSEMNEKFIKVNLGKEGNEKNEK